MPHPITLGARAGDHHTIGQDLAQTFLTDGEDLAKRRKEIM